MDSVKLDLFHDVVYVFTPQGMVKELPERLHAGRFCVFRSHGDRGSLRRSQGQRQNRPAETYDGERGHGGNFDRRQPDAAP